MILQRRLGKILLNIYPKKYMKYVVLYKGVKVLYVKLQQTIYGLLHSALMFYLKWSTYLKKMVSSKTHTTGAWQKTGSGGSDGSGMAR